MAKTILTIRIERDDLARGEYRWVLYGGPDSRRNPSRVLGYSSNYETPRRAQKAAERIAAMLVRGGADCVVQPIRSPLAPPLPQAG